MTKAKIKLKTCKVCLKEKSIKRDFYQWRAQCIDCFNAIKTAKYQAKATRTVVVVDGKIET